MVNYIDHMKKYNQNYFPFAFLFLKIYKYSNSNNMYSYSYKDQILKKIFYERR